MFCPIRRVHFVHHESTVCNIYPVRITHPARVRVINLRFPDSRIQGHIFQVRFGCNARIAYSVSVSRIRSNARAGPVGFLRPCSQFLSVDGFTPISMANLSCDRPVRSRITRTSGSGYSKTREALAFPCITASACFTLASNSSNSSSFIVTTFPQFAATLSVDPGLNPPPHSLHRHTTCKSAPLYLPGSKSP